MYTIIVEGRVEKFIKGLQKSTQGKVIRLKKLMVEYGADLGMPHSKMLSRKLYELRVRGQKRTGTCKQNSQRNNIAYML